MRVRASTGGAGVGSESPAGAPDLGLQVWEVSLGTGWKVSDFSKRWISAQFKSVRVNFFRYFGLSFVEQSLSVRLEDVYGFWNPLNKFPFQKKKKILGFF